VKRVLHAVHSRSSGPAQSDSSAATGTKPDGPPPDCLSSWVCSLFGKEYTVFSQNGEDGIIMSILENIDVPEKYYVEFGVQNGMQRNTRYLQARHGWHGLLLDGGFENPEINLHMEFIAEETIVDLFQKYAVPKNLGLLSVDIDSYDFWVLKNILEAGYKPAIIVTEVNSQAAPGMYTIAPANVTGQPYISPGAFEFGATPELFAALGKRHGYVMVHCESHGVNCFQVRADYLSTFDHENLPSSPRQRPLYGGLASSATCWPDSSKSTPWYELSPLDFSIISTDSQPARIADCSSVGP